MFVYFIVSGPLWI